MHAGACSKRAEVRAAAGQRVREQDAVHAAVEDGDRRGPLACDASRSNAGSTRSSASPSDSPPRNRSDSSRICSAPTNIRSSSARSRPSSRPPRHSSNSGHCSGSRPGRDQRRRLDASAAGCSSRADRRRRRRARAAPPPPARGRARSASPSRGPARPRTTPRRAASGRAASSSRIASQRAAAADRRGERRGVPRRPRTRQRPRHGDANRRRRRLELHLPAHARRRPVRAAPPAAAAAPAVGARHGPRGAARRPRSAPPASGGCAEIVAVCDDDSVLGVPFYVMRYLDGHVITDELPPGLETPTTRRALGFDLVDTLVEIHAADVARPELAAFARPGSYPERQVQRFTQLWAINRTRDLPGGRRGRPAGSPQRCPSRCPRRSCTATTASGT